jgi:hypothetical protein
MWYNLHMETVEPHIKAMIQKLAQEGRSLDEIAFLTRIGPGVVAAILGQAKDGKSLGKQGATRSVNTTGQN